MSHLNCEVFLVLFKEKIFLRIIQKYIQRCLTSIPLTGKQGPTMRGLSPSVQRYWLTTQNKKIWVLKLSESLKTLGLSHFRKLENDTEIS